MILFFGFRQFTLAVRLYSLTEDGSNLFGCLLRILALLSDFFKDLRISLFEGRIRNCIHDSDEFVFGAGFLIRHEFFLYFYLLNYTAPDASDRRLVLLLRDPAEFLDLRPV